MYGSGGFVVTPFEESEPAQLAAIQTEYEQLVAMDALTSSGLVVLLRRLDSGDLALPQFDRLLMDVAARLEERSAYVVLHRLSSLHVEGAS